MARAEQSPRPGKAFKRPVRNEVRGRSAAHGFVSWGPASPDLAGLSGVLADPEQRYFSARITREQRLQAEVLRAISGRTLIQVFGTALDALWADPAVQERLADPEIRQLLDEAAELAAVCPSRRIRAAIKQQRGHARSD